MNEQQLLRNPEVTPTSEAIAEALGTANHAYLKFVDGLKDHGIEVDWRYYNDGKAWLGKALYRWTTARGTPKEVTTLWLSIWDGFFRASLFIPEKVRAEVLCLPLDDGTKAMIEHAERMGKLTFFPLVFDLRSDELFDAIYTLADFRKTMK